MTLIKHTKASLALLGVSSTSKLLVAVSGGPDSLALAHALHSMRGSGGLAEITVAHVNHGIRPVAAEREENLVRLYCEKWNVPIEVGHAETMKVAALEKKGIEEVARAQRYGFFEELAKTKGFDFVLTAHTANDQAETVLMHLIRGAGVRGLSGIPPKRPLGAAFLIRPWLDIRRNEIIEYIRTCNLMVAKDTSNDDLSFQRNRVRHIVIPALTEAWPDRSPVLAITALAERMRELSDFLDALTTKRLAELMDAGRLPIEGLQRLSRFELHAVFEAWLASILGPVSISSAENARIAAWLVSKPEALELRGGVRFRKDGEAIWVEKNTESRSFEATRLIPGVTIATPYGEFLLQDSTSKVIPDDPWIARFDKKLVGHPSVVAVRPWRAGDRIVPFGMKGKHKLVSDLLTEVKIVAEMKKDYPVVTLDNKTILWVPGIRRSAFAPIDDRTLEVLEIRYTSI